MSTRATILTIRGITVRSNLEKYDFQIGRTGNRTGIDNYSSSAHSANRRATEVYKYYNVYPEFYTDLLTMTSFRNVYDMTILARDVILNFKQVLFVLGGLLARWFKCIYALVCLCRGCPGFRMRRVARLRTQVRLGIFLKFPDFKDPALNKIF